MVVELGNALVTRHGERQRLIRDFVAIASEFSTMINFLAVEKCPYFRFYAQMEISKSAGDYKDFERNNLEVKDKAGSFPLRVVTFTSEAVLAIMFVTLRRHGKSKLEMQFNLVTR